MTEKEENQEPLFEEGAMISSLINSHVYFLHWAFIIKDSKGFEVVFVRKEKFNGRLRCRTLRGARIAFSKIMSSYIKELKNTKIREKMPMSEWSDFYTPEPGWINNLLSEIEATENYSIYKNKQKEMLIERELKGRKRKVRSERWIQNSTIKSL